MIRMTIEISAAAAGPQNELGAGVLVQTAPMKPHDVAQAEGVTWAGICDAINEYMRARGCPDFDCMRTLRPTALNHYR